MKQNIVIGVLIAIVVFLVFKDQKEPSVVVKETFTVDTVYKSVPKPYPVEVKGDVQYLPSPSDTVVIEKTDTVYVAYQYDGEYPLDSGLTVLYHITSLGPIEKMSFGLYDTRPDLVKEIYKERTITQTKVPHALFASARTDSNLSLFIGLSYLKDRKMVNLDYDPFNKTIGFSLQYRLFGNY